jgi:O-antigen/teichoic acid export membrane protein
VIELFRTVYERLTAGGSTTEQAIQSGIWVAGINVTDRILQLLKVVILARLLSPEAFGLLGIALLSIAALRQFSKLGFDEALIQHEDDDVDAYLNTAWVMKIIRGLGIAVVAFLAAPYLAVFFSEAQAEPLIRVVGISPLILSLQNPAVMYFQKNLNFHKEFVYQVGGRVVDLIVALVIALVFRSVWALVAGIIAMNFMKFMVSYSIHKYRPSIEFDLTYGEEMFGFGKWLFVSAILVFLYGQGDDIFVGWFFAASSLGVYQLAYRFSNAPATEITHVISRVAFPALSKVQSDTAKLREGFRRAVQISTTVAFPIAAGIAAVAPQFVPIALGNQWQSAIPVMQVLAVWGGIRAFGANVGPIYKSTGHPDIEARIQALKVIIIAIIIYPTAQQFGVVGVASTIVLSSFIPLPIHLYYVSSITQEPAIDILKLIVYPLVSSIAMAGCVVGIETYVLTGTNILNLIFLIILGIITYFVLMIIFEYIFGVEFTQLYSIVKQRV